MEMKELRDKYGRKNAIQSMSAAIWSEISGGNPLIDLIGKTYRRIK